MLKLNETQEFWGIASSTTDLTGNLWCADQFVFRHQAQTYCDNVDELLGMEVGLKPVLVKMTATLASEEDANDYDAQQVEFLARRRTTA